MQWVRVDPSGEWLAHIRVSQPDTMLAAQLERSQDLLAQHAALVKLVCVRVVDVACVGLCA